jgi:sialic acid synthase
MWSAVTTNRNHDTYIMHSRLERAMRRSDDVFVIAEVGHNHQGSVDLARKMFRAAKDAGADAVKLQKRCNRKLFVKSLYDQPYENENSFGATYGQHREALEFGREQYRDLKQYAEELDIILFATAFDRDSVDFLEDMDMPAYKIASGDLSNLPLLRYLAKTGKPLFLSTGGGTLTDIRRACDNILPTNPRLAVLHCTASYPAAIEDLNLAVIRTLLTEFPDNVIGLSDHENGIDAASIAYMLGARVFEKHFTLNRASKGTDHSFSLEPEGLRKLVRNLKRIPVMLGDGVKRRLPSEEKPLLKMSKSLVAARDLPAGHTLRDADIAAKSPGGGTPPSDMEMMLGRKLRRSLTEDAPILLKDVE